MSVEDFDRLIDAVGKIGAAHHLMDKIAEATKTDARKCGNCDHWMKSNCCPQETRNRAGRREGPSMNAPACSKFQLEQWVADLKAKRVKAAVAYAEKHGLPIPVHFAQHVSP